MKKESDNFRSSVMQDIIDNLKNEDIQITIFEPSLDKDTYKDCKVIKNKE